MEEFLKIAAKIIDPNVWYWNLILGVAVVGALVVALGKLNAVYHDVRGRQMKLEERKIELEIAILKQTLKAADPENELLNQPQINFEDPSVDSNPRFDEGANQSTRWIWIRFVATGSLAGMAITFIAMVIADLSILWSQDWLTISFFIYLVWGMALIGKGAWKTAWRSLKTLRFRLFDQPPPPPA